MLRKYCSEERDVSCLIAADMDISEQSNYSDYEWSITLNRTCLRLLGIWPEKTKHKTLIDAYVIFILIVLICGIGIPTLHSLIRIWGDLMLVADNLQYTLPYVISVLKLFILWQKKKELAPVLEMIKKDWLNDKTIDERNIMIRRAQTTRIFTLCGYFLALILFIICMIIPAFTGLTLRYVTNITDPDKVLPVQTYYPYNINESPFYELTCILQSICVLISATTYTTTDTFMGLLIFHVCGQLENLRARILQLSKDNFESTLSYNVQDHRRLIRFCIYCEK